MLVIQARHFGLKEIFVFVFISFLNYEYIRIFAQSYEYIRIYFVFRWKRAQLNLNEYIDKKELYLTYILQIYIILIILLLRFCIWIFIIDIMVKDFFIIIIWIWTEMLRVSIWTILAGRIVINKYSNIQIFGK